MTTTHAAIQRLAQALALDPADDDAQAEMLRVLGRVRREREAEPALVDAINRAEHERPVHNDADSLLRRARRRTQRSPYEPAGFPALKPR